MPTKKTPEKVAKPEVTPQKIEEWKLIVKRLAKRAAPYNLDLDDIEKRLHRIEAGIPKPPPVIRAYVDCKDHQEYLRKLSYLRTQLTKIQTRCTQTKAVWGHVIKIVKSFLWSQDEMAAMKNDTVRGTILKKVAGKLDWNYMRIGALIDMADKITWTLKDNQRAVLGMVHAAGEGRFLYQQGMEQ